MANDLLLLGMIGTVGCVFLCEPPPVKPVAQTGTSRMAAAVSPTSPYASAGPSGIVARQDPVPLVRNASPTPPLAPASREPPAVAEQDDSARSAAKTAAELDGYKRVSIVGKASNGAWRVKGHGGPTEVLLTVDGTGRVSMD